MACHTQMNLDLSKKQPSQLPLWLFNLPSLYKLWQVCTSTDKKFVVLPMRLPCFSIPSTSTLIVLYKDKCSCLYIKWWHRSHSSSQWWASCIQEKMILWMACNLWVDAAQNHWDAVYDEHDCCLMTSWICWISTGDAFRTGVLCPCWQRLRSA